MSFRKRIPTAIFLIALVFVSIQFLPPLWFFIVLQVLILAALVEFYNLSIKKELFSLRIFGAFLTLIVGLSFFFKEVSLELALFLFFLLSAVYFLFTFNKENKLSYFISSITITIFGALYIGFTLNFFFLLREEDGRSYVYFLLAVIFLGDSGAYFLGKLIGKHKQFPVASPYKTWEGGFGGILFAAGGATAAQQILLPEILLWKAVLCGVLIHVVAQMSDPLESLFKRAAGVKDSSNLLPGHGGILDRTDSLILAAPFFYFFIKYFWK